MEKSYIYGKLNKEVILKEYTGSITSSAKTTVNNAASTISVDVIRVPHKLTIKEAQEQFTNFDGSSDVIFDLTPYAKSDIVPNYAEIDSTGSSHNWLVFYRKENEQQTELFKVEISGFQQVQSNFAEENQQLESYIRNKETKYLLNNGSDGTDVYTEKNYVDTQDSNLRDYVDSQDTSLQNEIGVLSNLSTESKSNLVSAINENKSNLDSESLTRANNDNALQGQIGTLSNLETTNKTTLVAAINENKNSIDTHIVDISNPHSVTKDQVGLGNVDNTSDLDKPISTATQNALNLKLNATNTDQNISKNITLSRDISAEPDPDYLAIKETQINLSTQVEDSNTYVFDLADSGKSGLMSSQDVQTLNSLVERVSSIEGKTTRLLYSASQNPSASDINTFVTSLGYTSPFEGIAVVISGTYHIWHYYENNNIGWKDDGQDTVSDFTNSTAGIILGSATDGKVYAESNGTGSVYGWSDLKGRVSDTENNITSLQTNKADKNYVDSELQKKADITSIPTDIVKYSEQTLTDAQKSQARINIGAGTSNLIIKVNEIAVNELNFDSDPQTQIDDLKNVKLENAFITFSIDTSKWQALTGADPYKYSATIDCDYSITTTGEPIYELINDNVVNFATYGFALNEVSFGTAETTHGRPNFTFYAIEKPTESVNLRVLITATSVELIAQEGGIILW